MATKFAGADDCIVDLVPRAGVEEADAIHNPSVRLRNPGDKQQLDGMQFDGGYLSPFFVTDPERMEVALENVYILVYEKKISSRKDLLPLIDRITAGGNPLLIIAEDVEGEALASLVVNRLRGALQVVAVKAPGVGDQRKSMLQRIAFLTGARAITETMDVPLKSIQISDLGQSRKITIGKNNTVVEGSAGYERLLRKPVSVSAAMPVYSLG